MVKKLQKLAATKSATGGASVTQLFDSQLASSVKDSAAQIWQAGLGAFSKAQEEGGKVFETLVKEGLSIQRKTQSVAEERINEATSRVSHMANDISSKAQGQWDKLENIFEERVAKALGKLGVPAARDVEALVARIDELGRMVQEMSGLTPAKPARKPAAKPAAKAAAAPRKAPARKAPARKKAA